MYITAISYYLPERVMTNEELVSEFPEWSVEKVAKKVGVNSRHLAAPDETAGDMAEKAARRLFDEYGISPQDIDFVLLCTQSPDYHLPSTACLLQHRLGIPTTAGALDYDLACSGCIYGLALAKGLIAAGIAHNVLLLTAETYNKYIHPSDKSNRAIFGDGAAACLISAKSIVPFTPPSLPSHSLLTPLSIEIGNFALGTDGAGANNLIVKTGGSRQPSPTGIVTEDEEGHEWRDDNLYMNGSAIFNFTLDAVPAMMERVLQANGMTKDQVDYYVFHQANKFMLDTLRMVCQLPKDKFYIDLSTTGNTVSSSVLIALRDCLDRQLIGPGSTVMVAGFGTGLSLGSTILKFQ
ncbi:MAG: ketoacyl-ACP synthase III [Prevotella sp.]|nr:ketoacyl-ACP synthase III [Prevotella sp.]